MIIIDEAKVKPITAGDGSSLKELLSPKNKLGSNYSLAHAVVRPGNATKLHRLKSSEVYYIIHGEGEMYIDDEIREVKEGNAIYIPPNSRQKIMNTGSEDLVLLCIVDPAWEAEQEEILEK
ncbi:MAG TPA: cupin domain-containing protein [archaeon]|nr:cupin domain-containing protein [archaeon]